MRTAMIYHPKLRKEERARITREYPGLLSKVARECGVHPTTIQRYFHGVVKNPRERISLALQVALREIGVGNDAAA